MVVDKLLSRVLYIDLTRKRFWVEDRRDLFEECLGGVGVAIKLLKEVVPRGADPLGPENAFVLAVGPFTAMYPAASKTVAVFKSPHTGNLGESHCGGRSAIAIRMAGFGAIVVTGASDKPVYLVIRNGKVYFRDASSLWGMRSSVTVARVIREAEPGAGMRTIMRIGRAGEKLVTYASVITETYRHFGRLGLGAVWGSKKLKAMLICGSRTMPVADPKAYREVYDEIYKLCVETPLMKKYHDLGTAMNILPLNKLGALPTRNLTSSRFEKAEEISGEKLAEERLGRRVACSHCPVACIHLAALREPYPDEPYFYKTTFVSYDYEPLYALGSMLGMRDTDSVLKLIDAADVLGLDAMSAGVCLAWATEALKRGIISVSDTIVHLDWGFTEGYIQAMEYIVEQPNEFYKTLARGVKAAAEKYGGKEFALAFGGNEMPGYHTGPACHIGYTIGLRHSHLDNAGYSTDQKLVGKEYPGPEELIDKLIAEEEWRQILSSLVVCFFARGIYKPELVVKALKPLGIELTEEQLKEIGAKIYREKVDFKVREGWCKEMILDLPKRIFETPTPHGMISPDYIKRALEYYVEKMKIPSKQATA